MDQSVCKQNLIMNSTQGLFSIFFINLSLGLLIKYVFLFSGNKGLSSILNLGQEPMALRTSMDIMFSMILGGFNRRPSTVQWKGKNGE